MNLGGRSIALTTASVGLLVLAAALVAGKDRLREEWYLYSLDTGTTQQRLTAIRELEARRSHRAIPKFVAMLKREELRPSPSDKNSEVSMDGRAAVALINLGDPVVPFLASALSGSEGTNNLRKHAVNILERMPPRPEVIDALRSIAVGKDEVVAKAAARALMKIQGDKDAAQR